MAPAPEEPEEPEVPLAEEDPEPPHPPARTVQLRMAKRQNVFFLFTARLRLMARKGLGRRDAVQRKQRHISVIDRHGDENVSFGNGGLDRSDLFMSESTVSCLER